MQDYVSTLWVRMVGLVASLSLVGALFIPSGFPWMGLGWLSLALSVALWLRMRSPRSMAQVIDDIEAEPLIVAAHAVRVSPAAPKTVV
jgi:hypothetical protein